MTGEFWLVSWSNQSESHPRLAREKHSGVILSNHEKCTNTYIIIYLSHACSTENLHHCFNFEYFKIEGRKSTAGLGSFSTGSCTPGGYRTETLIEVWLGRCLPSFFRKAGATIYGVVCTCSCVCSLWCTLVTELCAKKRHCACARLQLSLFCEVTVQDRSCC